MKKLLSLILAVAMMMTIFCVVPVSAANEDIAGLYIYDDFSADTLAKYVIANQAGKTAPTVEYDANFGYSNGAMKISYPGDSTPGYMSLRLLDFHPSASNTSVALPIGAKVTLKYKVYYATMPTGAINAAVYTDGSGSSAWGAATGTVYTPTGNHFQKWLTNLSATASVTVEQDATNVDFRLPCNAAATASETMVMYIDDLELRVSMDDAVDGNEEAGLPSVTNATATLAANGALTLSYTYAEAGTTEAGDASLIKIFDGNDLLGTFRAGDAITVPNYNITSTGLKAVITPISAAGYIAASDVEVAIAPVVAETTNLTKVYYFNDFSNGIGGITVSNGTTEYAADKGLNDTGALKVSTVSGKYSNISIPVIFPGETATLPAGAKAQVRMKVRYESTVTADPGWGCVGTTNNGSNAWGTASSITLANSKNWNSMTMTSAAMKTDGTARVEFRMNSASTADASNVVYYIDELEFRILLNDGVHGAPTVTNATASVAANGNLNLNYTYTSTGTTASTVDASIIKVYDDGVLLGKYQAGGSFTIPAERITSENLTAVITPVSGWGVINGTDVTVAIAPAVVESKNVSKVYFFTDFAEDADGASFYGGNGNGTIEYAAGKGINGTGAIKVSVDSGKYNDFILSESFMAGDGREVNLPVGAKVQLKAKVKFETTPGTDGAVFGVVATTNNGSNAWGTGTTIPAATATTQWHDITLTTGARATTAGGTTVEFRMTNSSASADGNRHVFYLDEVELKLIYAAGTEFAAPTVTDAAASVATNGALNLNYTYTSAGTTASTLDASMIKVYDGDVLLGKYQAGGTFTIPEANKTSENLKAIITPISGWAYIGSDVTVAIAPAVVESKDVSKVYFFTDFATGADGVYVTAGNGNGASEYAADKGINGTGALKVSVDSGKYTDLAFTDSVMSGREVNLPVGAMIQLKAKVKFETTPGTDGAALGVVATTNNGANAWGTGTTIPAATATTQWHDITLTTQTRKTTDGNTTVEFRMTNNSASADGNRHVFYLDEVELKLIYAAGEEFAAPTVTDAAASVADNGALNLNYTYTSAGTTASVVDASMIKVYDGDVLLGKYQAGGSLNIPEANRASANLKVVITPISGWDYIGSDVEVAITPLALFEGTTLTKVDGGVKVAAASVTGAKLIFVSYDANFKMISAKFVDVTSVVNAEQTFTFAAAEFEEGAQNKAMLWQDKVNCKPLAAAIAW